MPRAPRLLPRASQSGIALITAVLVVALAAIAAAAMLSAANLAIHRTQNLQESEIAWWYASGVESWARSILERDTEQNSYDSLRDIWAVPMDMLPIDEGSLRGRIVDLQGRYNLNNLAATNPAQYKEQLQIFVRLYTLATETDEYQARAVAAAIRDYVDRDSEPTGTDGAEDSDYLGLTPPRRVPNRLMDSVSELLAVRGVTPKVYQRLLPHICALPESNTKINVNTATPMLMAALTDKPGTELQQFIEERAQKPAERIDDAFTKRQVFGPGAVSQERLSVSSDYFELQLETFVGSRRLALYSFLHRPGSAAPTVYGRSTFTE